MRAVRRIEDARAAERPAVARVRVSPYGIGVVVMNRLTGAEAHRVTLEARGPLPYPAD